jgi:hypothetical protein
MDFIKMAIAASLVAMSLNVNSAESIPWKETEEESLSLRQRLNILATYLSPSCRELDNRLASLKTKKERWEILDRELALGNWRALIQEKDPDRLKEIKSDECLYRLGEKYGLPRKYGQLPEWEIYTKDNQ